MLRWMFSAGASHRSTFIRSISSPTMSPHCRAKSGFQLWARAVPMGIAVVYWCRISASGAGFFPPSLESSHFAGFGMKSCMDSSEDPPTASGPLSPMT